MTTRKRTQSALRATLKQEDAAVAERLPEIAAANAQPSEPAQAVAVAAADSKASAERKAVAKPAVASPRSAAKRTVAKPAAPKSVTAKPAAPKPAAPKALAPKAAQAKVSVAKPDKPVKLPSAESDASVRSASTVKAAPKRKASAKPKAAAKPKDVAKAKAVAKPKAAKKTLAEVLVPALAPELRKENAGKVVRDSFSMPKSEHAELKRLRAALAKAGRLATKSEVLRAAMKLLRERSTKEVVAVLDGLPVVLKGKGKKQG